jgi:hypothetical protein
MTRALQRSGEAATERDARLAVVSIALGTLGAGISEVIPGALGAVSAAGDVLYDK